MILTPGKPRENIIKAAQALQDGQLVAFPTETVYGLGADASNENAVRQPHVHLYRDPRSLFRARYG